MATYQVFLRRGKHDFRWLSQMSDGSPRWTLTRGDANHYTRAEAKKVAASWHGQFPGDEFGVLAANKSHVERAKNPAKRLNRAAKLRRERDRLEKKLAATPTNVDASAIISRLGDLNVAIADAERKQNPARPSAIPKSVRDFALRHQVSVGRDGHGVYFVKEHGQVVQTTTSAKPTAANAIAMIKRHLRQHQKEGAYTVPKKNPRRRMGAQARKDFARRMAAARERKQAKKRLTIKRQIRRAGVQQIDSASPTRHLRAQRAATQARGMYQIGALSADKALAWYQGNGFTLLRGGARGYASLADAKHATRNLAKGLVAGIFRSDVSAERARKFLLGKL